MPIRFEHRNKPIDQLILGYKYAEIFDIPKKFQVNYYGQIQKNEKVEQIKPPKIIKVVQEKVERVKPVKQKVETELDLDLVISGLKNVGVPKVKARQLLDQIMSEGVIFKGEDELLVYAIQHYK
jgi:hypothetical protein